MKPPVFSVLDWQETPIGGLVLRRRELPGARGTLVTEATLDGVLLMSSHHTISERALAERALARHTGRQLDVLIGGLGLGYTAEQALASPRVERVTVVERLHEVIAWFERGLVPLAALRREPRLQIETGDVYARLLGDPAATHDLLLIDVDHSPHAPLDPASERFYTAEGLRAARRHLRPCGVLAVWSTADDDAFAAALGEVFEEVAREPIVWWNELVDEEKTDTLFLASRGVQ